MIIPQLSNANKTESYFGDAPEVPQDPAQAIRFLGEKLTAFAKQAAAEGLSLYDMEKATLATVLEIGHNAIEMYLQEQGDGDLGPTVVTEQGRTLKRSEEPKERRLRTLFGQHTFSQHTYSKGAHKEIELYPVDAAINVDENVPSPLLAEFSQWFCVEEAFATASNSLEMVISQTISVSMLERINNNMGQQAESFMESLPKVEPDQEGEILVITADGKGVPMVKNDRAGASQTRSDSDADGDSDADKPADFACSSKKPSKQGAKRMATVAGVYTVDRHVRTADEVLHSLFREPSPAQTEPTDEADKPPRPKPQHKRLFASFGYTHYEGTDEELTQTGVEHAVHWAAGEAGTRHQHESDQPVVVICDGQQSLWTAVRTAIAVCFAMAPKVVEILDLLHPSSYVWKAAKAFYPKDHAAARRFVRQRMKRILEGEVAGVIRGMKKMCTERGLDGEAKTAVHAACRYLKANQHRMKYDEYLAAGYPIASGVIEGACRHLVKDRMERSGMSWTLRGAQSMLWVRCIYASGLWGVFQEYRQRTTRQRVHPNRKLVAKARSSPNSNLAV